MPVDFVVEHPAPDTEEPRILRTPHYKVSDNGFAPLIDFAMAHDRLPSDRSITMTQELASKASNIYATIRFNKAFNQMNDYAYIQVYRAYHELMAPILENLELLDSIGQIEYTHNLHRMCGQNI